MENQISLRRIINSIYKNPKSLKSSVAVDLSEIAEELGVTDFDMNMKDNAWLEIDARVKEYYVAQWYCTDTIVGISLIFLDDEFIALSSKKGRKCDTKFEFGSKMQARKMRGFIESLCEEDITNRISFLDLDKIFSDMYNLQFYSEYIPSRHLENAYLDNKKVIDIQPAEDRSIALSKVVATLEDGVTKEVDIKEVSFKINIVE